MSDAKKKPKAPAAKPAPAPKPPAQGKELSDEELGKASGGIIAVRPGIKPGTDPTRP
jgi:mersacidin/lichenicidin family type 2 lantibiotic